LGRLKDIDIVLAGDVLEEGVLEQGVLVSALMARKNSPLMAESSSSIDPFYLVPIHGTVRAESSVRTINPIY
jgi:hypothetical protein